MNEAERGYCAGIVDGEGCCSLVMTEKDGYITLNPGLMVGNTNIAIITWLKNTVVGGRVSPHSGKGNHRASYRWMIGNAKLLRSTLEEILPYLQAKTQQASLLLEFLKLHRPHGRPHGQSGIPTADELRIYIMLRHLNQRGVPKILTAAELIPPSIAKAIQGA